MKTEIESTAYHEAGHVIAYLLTERKFRYVWIDEVEKDHKFGEVVGYNSKRNLQNSSFTDPLAFVKHFEFGFQKIAGIVTEKLFMEEPMEIMDSNDFQEWSDTNLMVIAEDLRTLYANFLLKYTMEVLGEIENWKNIKAIAETLVKRKSLKYTEVLLIYK